MRRSSLPRRISFELFTASTPSSHARNVSSDIFTFTSSASLQAANRSFSTLLLHRSARGNSSTEPSRNRKRAATGTDTLSVAAIARLCLRFIAFGREYNRKFNTVLITTLLVTMCLCCEDHQVRGYRLDRSVIAASDCVLFAPPRLYVSVV